MADNFNRMIRLAEEIFAAHKDDRQIDVDETIIEHLISLHPASVTEHVDGDGPVVWILLIPTQSDLMQQFTSNGLTEKELLAKTNPKLPFDSIYLCSAMVLDEFRRQGLASKLTIKAIESIRKSHSIKSLFVWSFTQEGKHLAEQIAKAVSLPLYHKIENP